MIRARVPASLCAPLLFGAALAMAADTVAVEGSDVTFPTTISRTVAGKPIELVITGTGLREKAWFNVYVIASYVAKGAGVASAQELAQANVPKVLELVMERDVDGDDMAEAFEDAIRLNYPAPRFEAQLAQFRAYFDPKEAQEGKKITFTHEPGLGVRAEIEGATPVVVADPAFAKAVWEIYLGPKNVSDDIKRGLTSRLR